MAKTLSRTVSIYVDGKQVESSLSSLQKEMIRLVNIQRKMTIGSDDYIRTSEKIREINDVLREHRRELQNTTTTWENTLEKFSNISDIIMGVQSLMTLGDAAVGTLKDLAADAAALDDAYADVMKTTGMTKEQVLQLNDTFKKMDTRTSREQLNQLAYEAGKLGKESLEDVSGFVSAADKINIALGDVLGDGAMVEIGKLGDIYSKSTQQLRDSDLEGQMLRIGSAINSLGQASTANEAYMVDFLKRLGGIAGQANLSADQILGFASALDQNGQAVEMAATAFQKLIQQMIKKPEEFVDAAKMSLGDFRQLMETDMNQAIQRVLSGMDEMGSLNTLIPMFESMGLDGARAATVVASLAGSLDKVIAAQKLANEELQSGNSVLAEFNTKNETLQAQAEKAKKRFQDVRLELGEQLYPVLINLQKSSTVGLKVLSAVIKVVSQYPWILGVISTNLIVLNKKILANYASKLADYALDIKRYAIRQKENAQSVITAARLRIEAVERLKVTAATKAAVKAQVALRAAMAATPWGVIATLASAAAVAFGVFATKSKDAAASAESLSQKKADLAESSMRVRNEIQLDIRRAEELASAHLSEKSMVNELNDKYGDVFGTYSTLAEWLDVLKGKTEDYVEAMYLQAKVAQNIQDATEVDKELQAYKERGAQPGNVLQRIGRSASASTGYVNTLLSNIFGGQDFVEASASASTEFDRIQFAPIEEYYAGMEEIEQRKKKLLDEAAQDQKKLAELREKSGINIDGTIGTSSSSTTGSSFTASADAVADKFKAVRDSVSETLVSWENKQKEGVDQLFSEIDLQAQKLKDRIAKSQGGSSTEKSNLISQVSEAAERLKKSKFDEYLKKLSDESAKLLTSSSDNPMIQKIIDATEKLNQGLSSISKKRAQVAEDLRAMEDSNLYGVSSVEYERLKAMLELYDNAEAQLRSSAYSGIDTAVDISSFKLSGDVASDSKSYADLTLRIRQSREAAASLLAITSDPDARNEIEAQITELEEQQQVLDQIYAGAEAFAKRNTLQKPIDKWIKALDAFASKAVEIFSSINSIISNSENRQLQESQKYHDQKVKALDNELEQGIISQEEYNSQKKQLDADLEAEQKEIETRQFNREKALSIAEATIAGSLAALRVLSDPTYKGPAKWVEFGIVTAAALAQIAAIASEPAPYAKGGYTREPTILVGERGQEWVASNRLLRDPATAPVIQALEQYQRGNTAALDSIAMQGIDLSAVRSVAAYRQQQSAADAAMLSELRLLRQYLSDPHNRQAVISRTTQDAFDANENFLRNARQI